MKVSAIALTCLVVFAGCQKRETALESSTSSVWKTAERPKIPPNWIHDYAKKGDLESVQILLDNGIPVDQRKSFDNETGKTPLMWAANNGHLDIVRLLLDRGADVNADSEGLTALMAACGSIPTVNGQHRECVRALIDAGADLEARDRENQTPLFYACGYASCFGIPQGEMREDLRKFDQFRPTRKGLYGSFILQSVGPSRWRTMICGDAERVRLLLEAGANPNALLTYDEESESLPESLLMMAAMTSDVERVQLLLDYGADVNFVGSWGKRTPLICAAVAGNMQMFESIAREDDRFENGTDTAYLKQVLQNAVTAEENALEKVTFLLDAGLDVNAELPNGRSPILESIRREHGADVARLLIKMGASISMQEAGNPAYLLDAARFGPVEALMAILAKGGDPIGALSDRRHPTALIAAASSKVEAAAKVELLIRAGSNLEDVDYQEKTALTRAAIAGNMDAVIVLANAGADVNTIDKYGGNHRKQFSPLMYVANRGGGFMYACEQDGLAAAQALVANGANTELADEFGSTALDIAEANEQDAIVSFLKNLDDNIDSTGDE